MRATVSVPALPMSTAKLTACSMRQPAGHAVLLGDLHVDQVGEHVVARVGLAVGQRLADVVHDVEHGRRRDVVGHAGLGVEVEGLVDPAADHVAVLGRHAEEGGDHVGRDAGAEVLHVVERAAADQAVEQVDAQGADVVLEELHAPRREGLGDQAPVAGVLRRVHEDHHLHVDRIGRDHLHHRAVRRDERLGIAAEGVDVGEAAHGVEVVLLVVIEGLLVAQALPDGVRVGLVLLVERVPGEGLGVDGGHCGPPSTPTWWPSQSLMPPRMPALLSTTVMRSSTSPRSRRLTRPALPPPM